MRQSSRNMVLFKNMGSLMGADESAFMTHESRRSLNEFFPKLLLTFGQWPIPAARFIVSGIRSKTLVSLRDHLKPQLSGI